MILKLETTIGKLERHLSLHRLIQNALINEELKPNTEDIDNALTEMQLMEQEIKEEFEKQFHKLLEQEKNL